MIFLNSASAALVFYLPTLTPRENRERPESGIYFKIFEKKQNLRKPCTVYYTSSWTLRVARPLHLWPHNELQKISCFFMWHDKIPAQRCLSIQDWSHIQNISFPIPDICIYLCIYCFPYPDITSLPSHPHSHTHIIGPSVRRAPAARGRMTMSSEFVLAEMDRRMERERWASSCWC